MLLPMSSTNNWAAGILICGGGYYQDISSPADASCGTLYPEADSPEWEMDAMPQGRVMVEGVILADGKILFINGANSGAQGRTKL